MTRQPLWVILREREKIGRRDKRRDEREGQGRKRNRNESKETEEITFSEKNQQQVRQIKEYTRGTKKKKKKYVPPREQNLAHTCWCLPPPPIELN